MSKLQALATLMGMSKEYEEELHYLEEALVSIQRAKQRIGQSMQMWRVDSLDPDAEYFKRYPFRFKALLWLDDAEGKIKRFTEGVLKYE